MYKIVVETQEVGDTRKLKHLKKAADSETSKTKRKATWFAIDSAIGTGPFVFFNTESCYPNLPEVLATNIGFKVCSAGFCFSCGIMSFYFALLERACLPYTMYAGRA